MDSLPIDVLGLIFDAVETTTSSTADMSRVSKAWNAAWYDSKHWRRRIKVPRCRDATSLIAAMRRSGWRAEDVDIAGGPAELFETILDNFANLKSLSFAVESGRIHDIRATTTMLRSLRLFGCKFPPSSLRTAFPALEHVTLADCGVKASELPKSLRSLELIRCPRFVDMDGALLPNLESLAATDLDWDLVIGARRRREDDIFPGTYWYIPIENHQCPNLKTLRIENAGLVFFTTAETMDVQLTSSPMHFDFASSLSSSPPPLTTAMRFGREREILFTKYDTKTLRLDGGEWMHILPGDAYTISLHPSSGPNHNMIKIELCLFRYGRWADQQI